MNAIFRIFMERSYGFLPILQSEILRKIIGKNLLIYSTLDLSSQPKVAYIFSIYPHSLSHLITSLDGESHRSALVTKKLFSPSRSYWALCMMGCIDGEASGGIDSRMYWGTWLCSMNESISDFLTEPIRKRECNRCVDRICRKLCHCIIHSSTCVHINLI